MNLTYNFGQDYDYLVTIFQLATLAEEWLDVEDGYFFLDNIDNYNMFVAEYEDELKRYFYEDAYLQAEADLSDPYSYHGVSRSDF